MAARAKRRKQRQSKPRPLKPVKAGFFKRKKTTSEKVFIAVGILIAMSMLLSLVVNIGSSGRF
jgi:hypothetical protein